MKEKPTLNTVGMVIAHKKVNGKNIILTAIRGEKYDSEWGNNFIVGESGNAKGFDDSSKIVINRIKKYISDNNLNNNQIWISGYSRAGTIADLTGVYINNNLDEFKTNADDLYIYTFEAPAASIDNTIYDNIYTVRSVNDIIPTMYPKEWKFYTNGKIINIGEAISITTYKGLEEQVAYNNISLNDFYNEFFGWFTSRLDRKTYSEKLEEPISEILNIYFSKSEEERIKLNKFVMEDVKGNILDNKENYGKIKWTVWSIMGHNSDYLYQLLTNQITTAIDEVRNTPNGLILTDEEYNKIISYLYPILRVLGPIIVDDSNYYEGINYDEFYTKEVEDYLLTDEEMGIKYGASNGKDWGYDDGLYGNPKNENSYDDGLDDYGPIYYEAYKNAYITTYLEYYELGKSHRTDLVSRGDYDGSKYSYGNGYENGSNRDESIPYDEYLRIEDWMTDEYLNAYNAAYEREYLEGYADGLNNPVQEGANEREEKYLYHLLTIIKNINTIIEMHYPQENLKLIHNIDSYYAPYNLTQGVDEVINNEDDTEDNLVFKTSGHLEKLVKVQVDGKDLNDTDYELTSGSTILTLKNSFIKTLSPGTHELKLIYIDNTINTTFTIYNNISNNSNNDSNTNYSIINNPNTSDNIESYIVILIMGIFGLSGIFIIRKNYIK